MYGRDYFANAILNYKKCCVVKIMGRKEKLLTRLSNRYQTNNQYALEIQIINDITKSPYEKLSKSQYNLLFMHDYQPGTFYISERLSSPDFLFDEPNIPFFDWFEACISGEILQLCKNEDLKKRTAMYQEKELIRDSFQILFLRNGQGIFFCQTIANQEYSDYFRRIILYLLCNDSNYEINTYKEFNNLAMRVIPSVLECGTYTLRERLKQSIYSGLIGMDIKDELAATSPLSRNKIIHLNTNDSDSEKSKRVFLRLNEFIKNGDFTIDSWKMFEKQVIESKTVVRLCWFTDDYIPTLFEMKFMEELMLTNRNIFITIIPRVQAYSNDASWEDVKCLIRLSIFSKLLELEKSQRFTVCKVGMDMGTFNGTRLSSECAHIVDKSDFVIIAGARSYEMGQGINKNVFFTGIAVCRTYSETVTGICKDEGGIVFLYQRAASKSFSGFRGRSVSKKYCAKDGRWYPVANQTAIDYFERK